MLELVYNLDGTPNWKLTPARTITHVYVCVDCIDADDECLCYGVPHYHVSEDGPMCGVCCGFPFPGEDFDVQGTIVNLPGGLAIMPDTEEDWDWEDE